MLPEGMLTIQCWAYSIILWHFGFVGILYRVIAHHSISYEDMWMQCIVQNHSIIMWKV